MPQSTVTDKGQTTVPQQVREALNVKPRQRLNWEIRTDGSAVVRPATTALDLFGKLKPGQPFPGLKAEKEGTRRAIAEMAAKEGRTR
jgi:antitoxin PrlF